MLKGFSVFLCVCVCEREWEREREREREDICVCACVCVCVSDLRVCSHCTLERHRVRNVRERGYIPRSNPNLWLDAFCLYLPNPPATHWHTHRHTHTHTQAHAHTHSDEPIHPSPWHDCSSLVTLCSNPSVMSKTAITPGHRCSQQTESELWHGALLQIAIKVPFFFFFFFLLWSMGSKWRVMDAHIKAHH